MEPGYEYLQEAGGAGEIVLRNYDIYDMEQKNDNWGQVKSFLEDTFGYAKLFSLASWNGSKAFDADINLSSNLLTGSSHEVDNNVELIHYTTLNALFEIINSKTLRLTNATQTNDPQEAIYFFRQIEEHIGLDITELSSNMFIASFCHYNSSLKEKELFSMWRNYGDNGNGVGIVFKLANHNIQNKWIDSALGKIDYSADSKSLQNVKDYFSRLKELKSTGEFTINNLPKIIIQLACLNKSPIWREENEIRLFKFIKWNKQEWKYRNNERSFQDQIKATYKNNTVSYFTEIDLDNINRLKKAKNVVKQANRVNKTMKFSDEDAFDIYPALTIDKVILGYSIPQEKKWEVADVLRQLYYKNFKTNLQIENSMLTDFFK